MKSAAYLTNNNSTNVAITPLPGLYKHGISLGCLLCITADLTPQWQRRRVHLGLDTLQCLSMHLRGIIAQNHWKSRANLLKGINLLALFFCFALLHKLLCCFVLVLWTTLYVIDWLYILLFWFLISRYSSKLMHDDYMIMKKKYKCTKHAKKTNQYTNLKKNIKK